MSSYRPGALGLFLSLVLAACTDKEGDDGASEPGCECAEGDPCSVRLCETVSEKGGLDGSPAEFTEETLTCALEALRDGKAGTIPWTSSKGSGQFDISAVLELFGDGTARLTTGGAQDLCTSVVDEVVTGTLRSAQFFADCLAEPHPGVRFDCVSGALAETTFTCVEEELDCSGV